MRILLLLAMLLTLAMSEEGIVMYNETLIANDTMETKSALGNKQHTNTNYTNKLSIKYYNNISDDIYLNIMATGRLGKVDEYLMDKTRIAGSTNDIYLESAYLTYRLVNNWYIAGGVIPFTNGSYSNISGLIDWEGTSLIKIVNSVINGAFIMHKTELLGYNTILRVGYGVALLNEGIIDSRVNYKLKGTNSWYFSYDMHDGFDNIKAIGIYSNIKYSNILTSEKYMLGLGGYKYFFNTGIGIYGTLGYTITDVDATAGKVTNPLPVWLTQAYPNVAGYTRAKTSGFLYNVGIAKDITSNYIESYNIGFDYTHTTENWNSFVTNHYSDNINLFLTNGDDYHVWFTSRISTKVALKLFYSYLINNKARPIGNKPLAIGFNETPLPELHTLQRYGIKLQIRY